MSDEMSERLSTLIDGELARMRERRAVDEFAGDREQRERWARYHLIGDAMRGDVEPGADLAGRVRVAIDAEPVVLAPRRVLRVVPARAWPAAVASVFVEDEDAGEE